MALPLLPLAWPLIGKLAAAGTAAVAGTAIDMRNRGPNEKARQKARSRVNDQELRNIAKFETLGVDFDPEEAKKDPKYINNVYNQVHARLKAAGVDLDNMGTRKTKDGKEVKRSKDNLDDLVDAYNNLDDNAKKTYSDYKESGSPQQQQQQQQQQRQPTGPTNGTSQVRPAAGQASANAPLQPRSGPNGPSQIGTIGGTSRMGGPADASGKSVGGVDVSRNDDETQGHMRRNQRNIAAREELQSERGLARDRAEAQSDSRRNFQKYANDQFDLDRSMDDLRERKRAYREEQEQRRRDRRFQNRDLSNVDDWNNLGREGSNRRNYSEVQGETAEQKAEREAAVKKRQGDIDALRDRFAQMSDRTLVGKGEKAEWVKGRRDDQGNWVAGHYKVTAADGKTEVSSDELKSRLANETGVGKSDYSYQNKFYANDPNRQKELAALGKLVSSGGDAITDAQLEAATKKLDSWQAEADARGARVQAFQNMRNAEEAANLRQQYGFRPGTISDDAVRAFHEKQQKQNRTEILKGMQVAPGIGLDEDKKSAMAKFSDQWQKLLATGFDPNATLQRALKDEATNDAYMKGMASISSSDPDAADKRDQLNRRFIMQQAMREHGLTQYGGENGQAGRKIAPSTVDEAGVERIEETPTGADMARNLPGRSALVSSRAESDARQAALAGPESALTPKRGPTMTIVHSAQEARNAANQINQQIADNAGMAEYEALVAKNKASAVLAAPVKQIAAPPIPKVPKKDQTGAVKGGMSALRPRRRY